MKDVNVVKYVALIGCILLSIDSIVAQDSIASFYLFQRETSFLEVAKINTNTNEILLLEDLSEDPKYINIISLYDNDSIFIDTIDNIPIIKIYEDDDSTCSYDTSYSTPFSYNFYYIKDTLFFGFDYGIATYIKNDENRFKLNNVLSFDEKFHKMYLDHIIGYTQNKVVVAKSYFSSDYDYIIALYDTKEKTFTKMVKFNLGNSILLNYKSLHNNFASNNKYISIMNLIKPEAYLLDYDLNIVDTIDFSLNDEYKITQHYIDSICYLYRNLITPKDPKNIIYLLDTIKQLEYSFNMKQMFLDDTTLIFTTNKLFKDTCEAILVNTNSKEKKLLFQYPMWGYHRYTRLNDLYNMSLWNNGLFTAVRETLSKDEEHIDYYLDIFYSKELDFRQKEKTEKTTLLKLTDRKLRNIEINTKDYDYIVVFDVYLCKTCFVNKYL